MHFVFSSWNQCVCAFVYLYARIKARIQQHMLCVWVLFQILLSSFTFISIKHLFLMLKIVRICLLISSLFAVLWHINFAIIIVVMRGICSKVVDFVCVGLRVSVCSISMWNRQWYDNLCLFTNYNMAFHLRLRIIHTEPIYRIFDVILFFFALFRCFVSAYIIRCVSCHVYCISCINRILIILRNFFYLRNTTNFYLTYHV